MAHETHEREDDVFQGDPAPSRPEEFTPHDAARGEPPPRSTHPVVIPRWVQLVMLPLAILALWTIARAAGSVLLVFVVAAVVALILNPLVMLIQRRGHVPRGLAVAAVYIGLIS